MKYFPDSQHEFYQYVFTMVNIKKGLLFEIRKIAVCFPWLSMPGDYRVTDEALLAETT